MRHRNGIAGPVWVVGLIVVIVVIMVMPGAYHRDVTTKSQREMGDVWSEDLVGEEIMNAPCATEQPGIFYLSAVRSGSFDCVTTRGTLYLRFDVDAGTTETYRWTIDGGEITPAPEGAPTSQTYDVLVYDEETREHAPATLYVGVE